MCGELQFMIRRSGRNTARMLLRVWLGMNAYILKWSRR